MPWKYCLRRTLRIVTVELFSGLAYTIAQIGFGLLIKEKGFFYCYYLILCVHALNVIYLIFVLQETIHTDGQEQDVQLFFTLNGFKGRPIV